MTQKEKIVFGKLDLMRNDSILSKNKIGLN